MEESKRNFFMDGQFSYKKSIILLKIREELCFIRCVND